MHENDNQTQDGCGKYSQMYNNLRLRMTWNIHKQLSSNTLSRICQNDIIGHDQLETEKNIFAFTCFGLVIGEVDVTKTTLRYVTLRT